MMVEVMKVELVKVMDIKVVEVKIVEVMKVVEMVMVEVMDMKMVKIMEVVDMMKDTPGTRSHTPSRQASSTLSLTPPASWLARGPAVFTFHLVDTKMFLSPAILTREQ
ncbi:unnamed protein product [Rangifer tarandus platyrhynchus]|uniref:Uncharacterized protein n=1 Tax=Rangifer tarandus platyrhynchus TaxID=3082113 RepID=A0AC60A8Y0_RANTA